MTGARMWPQELSPQIRQDPFRRAEVNFFDALRQALPGGWDVFYSRPWLGLTPAGGERDGECDFVVVHPDRGVLTLEVKGGGISFEPSTDGWSSLDRNGNTWEIKNPVKQAMQAKHALLEKVKGQRGWPRHFVRFRHGVVFPDAQPLSGDLGADRPRELFCCRPDLNDLRGWIIGRLCGGESEQGPGPAGVMAIQNVVAKPFMLRVPLAYRLEDDEAAIAALTPEQYHVLDHIEDIARAAVGGGAGTGKTIVACEDARRLAEAGQKTLLTCRSLHLAADLRQRMKDSNVTVLAFSELASGSAPDAPAREDPAERLMQAAEADGSLRFDAIIVDEAQDFRNHWWIAIQALLATDPESRLHAYFDTNQQLYGPLSAPIKELALIPIRLRRNLRNTRTIHVAANHHYHGPVVTADGPAGVSVALHPVPDKDICDTVLRQIRALTGTESVQPADIVVLCPDARMRDLLHRQVPDNILCSTIIDFKGLERVVVIVAATRAIADQSELAYVGLSRARTHLVLVGDPVILDWLIPADASKPASRK